MALVGIVCHERRHELRRRLNGGRARSMGLAHILSACLTILGLATCGAFFFADEIAERLIGKLPAHESSEKQESLEKRLTLLKQDLQKAELRYHADAAMDFRRGKLLSGNAAVLQDWKEAREEIGKIAAALAVQGGIVKHLEDDAASLKGVSGDLANQQSQIASCYQRRRLISGGLGLGLIGMIAIGGVLFQRVARRQREKMHNTCPLCLGEGTFESLPTRHRGTAKGRRMMRCRTSSARIATTTLITKSAISRSWPNTWKCPSSVFPRWASPRRGKPTGWRWRTGS